jgi:actin-like ATPase involved in cell morphogenesis
MSWAKVVEYVKQELPKHFNDETIIENVRVSEKTAIGAREADRVVYTISYYFPNYYNERETQQGYMLLEDMKVRGGEYTFSINEKIFQEAVDKYIK